MESISAIILRAFDLKCLNTVKHKSSFICKTDKGRMCVLRAPQDTAQIWFRYHVKEHLHRCGFTGVERLCLSAMGTPFASYDGETFVVMPHLGHREASFADADEWRQIVRTTAQMHFLCRDIDFADGSFCAASNPHVRGRADADALNGYKRRILKKGKYSEFDLLFLRTFDENMAALSQWLKATATPAFTTLLNEAQTQHFVCHNSLKEENILVAPDGTVSIRNFAECAPGHFLFDLAALVKRYMKSLPAVPVPLDEVLDIYHRENPLCDDALAFLRAALIFPDKYIKLCAQYYDRNRTWTPGAFISRMEELARGMSTAKGYLQNGFL